MADGDLVMVMSDAMNADTEKATMLRVNDALVHAIL